MRPWKVMTLLLGLLSLSQTALGQSATTIIHSSDGDRPIEICGINIKTQIYARVMVSTTEICLGNPNAKILEGSLSFPLRAGQTVTRFTLGTTEAGRGVMEAVPVPKAKATQVFEAIERTLADPALLERAEGNVYSLRVYPLLPNKERVVFIETVEPLIPDAKGRNHVDPGAIFAGVRGGKNASLVVEGETFGIPSGALRFKGFKTYPGSGGGTHFVGVVPFGPAGGGLHIDWTAPGGDAVMVGTFEGESYFYADIPVSGAVAPRPKPSHVALIWDASSSGGARDHASELALLDGYFRMLGQVEVTLAVTRDQPEPPRQFAIVNGDWSELRKVLDTVVYDGATSQAAWIIPPGFGGKDALALLVSDGLANWGAAALPSSSVPLFTVNAALAADANRLRHLAEDAKGQYLDLTRLSTQQALAELTSIRPRLTTLTAEGADQLVSGSVYSESGRMVLAGRLTGAAAATVTLDLADGVGKLSQKRIAIRPSDDGPFAAKRWAELRIAALEGEGAQHRAEILSLGERFSVLSGETSLLALERIEDFLRYDVMPPPGGMRAEFLSRRVRPAEAGSDSAQINSLVQRFGALAEWWGRDFPKDEKPKPKPAPESTGSSTGSRSAMSAPVAMAAPAKSSAASASPSSSASTRDVQIHLRKWEADAPYVRQLKEASPEQRYSVYLEQRRAYTSSTAFFIDAADIFFEAGQADLAVRIASNVAELGWHNRSLLRILAYRLQQAGRVDLALPLLLRIRDLAPEEPQSWRDLGLANAAAGNVQQAIDFLWYTASRRWDSRFADIDLISLEELNALAARNKAVDLSRIDPRLTRNLPVELRAVLTWDADNSDMDLWVIDPNGEKAFYGNRLTYQGGHMSRDFIAGLGPEEFLLKQAKPGSYTVLANFYGHRQQILSPYTTLMLKLSTGFGTENQKDQDIVLRLSGRGETVTVGTFEVSEKGISQ
ncbi:Protein conserved in bacteria [Candidatus Terasakiella magnetica]|nr:Protein conserved in bacteria [Candidatus Terasakiella magnetica]